MRDRRVTDLAKMVVGYSINVQRGEKVIINCNQDSTEMVTALIEEIYSAGGYPFVNYRDERVEAALSRSTSRDHLKLRNSYDKWKTNDMDAVIYLRSPRNIYEDSIVSEQKKTEIGRWNIELFKELGIDDRRYEEKPCVMIYPTEFTARAAMMGYEEYRDFYFEACLANYPAMLKALNVLSERMGSVDKVRMIGIETDLQFSIKGMKTLVSAGDRNMPDGEAYVSPVLKSVNGKITYNIPSPHDGTIFENICFEFVDGRITKATSNYTERLNKILDVDEGARYIGEFAISVNPSIDVPTGSILFDEKMKGSIHFTPGNEIWKAGNGNKSALHWDIVYSQLPQYGGGEMWFDDVLVRKDGVFVVDELKCCNPENLL
jgi:aminopeptidase